MSVLFALALFASSALLFVVEPMVGRLLLPLFGGTPAVWNTCMVFFQALLLAGYAYAHLGPTRLGVRRHALLHMPLLLAPLLLLPFTLPSWWTQPERVPPVAWLLLLLAVMVGLPFFVLSTSAPLLQRWLADTDHPRARDPYFLYVASNLGSLLGLLAYPFLLEPLLPLSAQRSLWAVAYGVTMVLLLGCVVALFRSPRGQRPSQPNEDAAAPPLGWRQRTRWIILAFAPSSLLLSVTAYLTTDVAAIPLLWVLPLALYLLSFILVFGRRRRVSQAVLGRGLPLVVLVLVLVILSEATEPVAVLIVLHLAGLFWVGLFCHGALAADRPPARYLTEFYLWLSVGGVLGGLFNALLAPLLFSSIIEYPLVLVLVCLLRPTPTSSPLSPEAGERGERRKPTRRARAGVTFSGRWPSAY